MILKADNVCKTISGHPILRNINLEMKSGNIYGVCGQNGCGKTMLIRALSGLMSIDSGHVYLNEKELHKDFPIMPNLGITIEHAGMFPSMTGLENLKIFAEVNRKVELNEIANAIERVGLDPSDKRVYRKYSLGMKQRIAIAQAIMEKPDLLFLDEPTNGLDENGVEKIREVLMGERDRGAIVLLVSHSKEDFEVLCNEIIYMREGEIT